MNYRDTDLKCDPERRSYGLSDNLEIDSIEKTSSKMERTATEKPTKPS
jgi:hypothetical protein